MRNNVPGRVPHWKQGGLVMPGYVEMGLADVLVETFQDKLVSKQTSPVSLGQTTPVLLLGEKTVSSTPISGCAVVYETLVKEA